MDKNTTDLDQARKEAIGYVHDRRHSKEDGHQSRKSKSEQRRSPSKSRRSKSRSRGPTSPRGRSKPKEPSSPRARHNRPSTRSSRHGQSKSTTRRDEEDREAKRRSRRSNASTVLSVPGAVVSTGEHKSRSKSSRRTSDSKEKEKHRRSSTTRTSRPGAVSESRNNHDRRASSKSSKKTFPRGHGHGESKNKHRPTRAATTPDRERSQISSSTTSPSTSTKDELDQLMPPFAMDSEEPTVAATMVDEDDEEERFRKRMAKREAEIRTQMAMQQYTAANGTPAVASSVEELEEQHQKPEPRTSGRGHKICYAFICLVLIAVGIVGALFGTGVLRSSSAATPSVSDLDDAPDNPDAQASMDTTNPTSPPTVGVMDTLGPTFAPTFLAYDPPDPDQCELIEQGLAVEGQEEMIENNFALVINGTMSIDFDIEDLKAALATSIQKIVTPKLTGCGETNQGRGLRKDLLEMERRRLDDPYVYIVGNVIVVDITSLGECVENETCESFQVDIVLYTQGDEVSTMGLVGRISDAFNSGESLVVELQIDDFFDEVELVAVQTLDPTPVHVPSNPPSSEQSSVPTEDAPSEAASSSPTFAPVTFPTTDAPTKSPSFEPTTGAPSKTPSEEPTDVPTPRPSLRPSIQPAPGATLMPTSEPSKLPTNVPTPAPTSGPTNAPTSGPTSGPTFRPTMEPTSSPTNAPTSEPTSSPTPSPTSSPTDAPSASPTVKTRLQIITEALVSVGIDENDFHADIIYWMDTVDSWEPPSEETFHWAERYAMGVYFKETQGNNWILLDTGVSDRSGVSICSWDGVSCDTTDAVSSFVTNNNWAYSSSATIPTEMGLLTNLAYFKSQSGDIAESGTIPAGILSMTALTQLRLDDSLFTSIADVSVLSNLKYLDMRDNTIIGSATPDDLCEMTQLTKLILYQNDHSSPLNMLPNTIPTCIGQLSDQMKHFTLGYLNLEGTIPSQVAALTKLTLLNLRNNDFDAGSYPDFVNGLTTLKSLLLDGNQMTGTIPASISSLTALTLLDLGGNDLTGSIPALPNNGVINTCRLGDNNFSDTSNAHNCSV